MTQPIYNQIEFDSNISPHLDLNPGPKEATPLTHFKIFILLIPTVERNLIFSTFLILHLFQIFYSLIILTPVFCLVRIEALARTKDFFEEKR